VRKELLDALAVAGATYVVGNHDIDLEALIGSDFLAHPFFRKMTGPFSRTVGRKTFHFLHGHEVDEFNQGDRPGKGRALTILAGLAEDRFGSPFLDNERTQTVEAALTWFGELALHAWAWLVRWTSKVKAKTELTRQKPTPRQKPSLLQEHLLAMKAFKEKGKHEAIICGHTHALGTCEDWYFNSGGWAEKTNDVLQIDADGNVTFHAMEHGKLIQRDGVPVLEI